MSIIPSFFGLRSTIYDPFHVDLWDPFKDLCNPETIAFSNAHIDWKENADAHIFKVDVPGLKKEEVKVEIEEGKVLKISGEKSKEVEEKNDNWYRVERSSGKFLRTLRLPENAKVDQMKAGMENGVLTVTVPKVEGKKTHGRLVEISG